jgi:hypothetical protein
LNPQAIFHGGGGEPSGRSRRDRIAPPIRTAGAETTMPLRERMKAGVGPRTLRSRPCGKIAPAAPSGHPPGPRSRYPKWHESSHLSQPRPRRSPKPHVVCGSSRTE